MKSVNLFAYWEGPMPGWIEVCIDSMRQTCGCAFHLITPQNMRNFLTFDPPKNFDRLVHASQRSEWLRAALLLEHGGFYFDADTVGIKDVRPLAVELSNTAMANFFWQRPPTRACSAYIHAKEGSVIVAKWLERSTKLIHDFTPEVGIGWTDLSEKILTPLVTSNDENMGNIQGLVRSLPMSTFMPVDIEASPQLLFQDHEPDDFITPDTVCFGLNGSWMMHPDWGRPDLMNSDPSTWQQSKHLVLKLLGRHL